MLAEMNIYGLWVWQVVYDRQKEILYFDKGQLKKIKIISGQLVVEKKSAEKEIISETKILKNFKN